MSKPIGEETAAPIPYANIDGRRVAVLHGRVAKTPDGRIHEVETPATMMRDIAPVTKCTGWPVASRETQSAVHNEPCECQAAHNAAAMREVLDRVHHYLGRLIRDDLVEDAPEASDMADDVWDALNEPPRNCDVGTAWEQAERFKEYCHSNSVFYRDMFGHDDEGRLDGWDCKKECPVGLIVDGHECLHDHCELVWAQMPYTETKKEDGAE